MASPTGNPSKKRKLSELNEEPLLKRNHKNKSQQDGTGNHERHTSPIDEDPIFKVYCPADPEDPDQEDACEGEITLAEGFHWKYRVMPKTWENIRSYRNVKLHEQTFTTGDLIYVNRRDRPPKAPSKNLTDRGLLEYDQKNFWVGQIVQARANSAAAVYLLVAWLYWPHELPKNVQKPYHADGELILSNAMDVVDATTISSFADVYHYEELGDDIDKFQPTPERFWRQTFNAGAYMKDELNPPEDVLSPLKVYCLCKQPHNPNKTMFHCSSKSCRSWLHEECLVDDMGKKVYDAYSREEIDKFMKENEPIETFAHRALQPVKAVAHFLEEKLEEALESGVKTVEKDASLKIINEKEYTNKSVATAKMSNKRGKAKKRIWDQTFSVSISSKDTSKPLVAIVKEKEGQLRSWQVRVECLVCGKTMD